MATEVEAQMSMIDSTLESLIELSREHTMHSARLREGLEDVLLAYARGNIQDALHKANSALSAFNTWVRNNEESGAGTLANLREARRRKTQQPTEG
ncbi:MAG TPA: hypothetical protein VM537_34415 [Anaerolineae bacterium]|nr:hypothetical protein [Anaerolineae bacterium]